MSARVEVVAASRLASGDQWELWHTVSLDGAQRFSLIAIARNAGDELGASAALELSPEELRQMFLGIAHSLLGAGIGARIATPAPSRPALSVVPERP